MRPFCPFILAVAATFCLACASGPAPPRAPKDIHQAIRHLNKGTAYYIKGCYPKALQHFQDAHERFVAADHLPGTADSLNSLSNTYYRLGDDTRALAVYDETIALFRQMGDRLGLVRALANKSATLGAARRLDEAVENLDQADDVAKENNLLAALRLKTRAILLIEQNDPHGAEALLIQSLRTAPDAERALLADIHYTIGHLMLTTRRPEPATAHFETALKLDRAGGAYFSIGMDLEALGDCFESMERNAEALGSYKRSLKIFALMGSAHNVEQVLPKLKTIAAKADPPDLSLQSTLRWAQLWLAGSKEAALCR